MKRKEILLLFLLFLVAASGWFIGGYGGGVVTGICLAFLIAATAGKLAAHKTMAKIDRNVYSHRDIRS